MFDLPKCFVDNVCGATTIEFSSGRAILSAVYRDDMKTLRFVTPLGITDIEELQRYIWDLQTIIQLSTEYRSSYPNLPPNFITYPSKKRSREESVEDGDVKEEKESLKDVNVEKKAKV